MMVKALEYIVKMVLKNYLQLVIFSALMLILLEYLGYVCVSERIRSLIWWRRKKIMGNQLPNKGRKNLEDDGIRSWEEEIESYLTTHYPNWRQTEQTVMVPDIIQGGSPLSYPLADENAETKVFELLKKFGNETQQPMFVVHDKTFCELVSYFENGYRKTEWIHGQHDFVIIHRQHGLIFLEVKGRDRTKEAFKKGEKQVEKARKSIESHLRKRFGKSKEINGALFSFPGFVIMPNCPRPKQSGFHDHGIFKEDCENVNSFQNWWNKAIAEPEKQEFNSRLFEDLVKNFVHLTCSAPTLTGQQIDKTHKNIVCLTPNQLKSWYKSCPEQWISGPAGSGKTVLLIEKVKQIAADIIKGDHNKERILVLCCSVPLSVHLNNEISDWFKSDFPSKTCPVHVKTYDSYINKILENQKELLEKHRSVVESKFSAERRPPEEHVYEHIFVDEGQDMVGDRWPDFLKNMRRSPVTNRRYYFWIMYDSNQHLQRKEKKRSFLDKIVRNTSQLTEVLRNTENIFSLSNKYYRGIYEGQITLGHKEIGLEVKYDNRLTKNKKNMHKLVAEHVKDLRNRNVKDEDIAILVRTKVLDTFIKVLDKEHDLRCVSVETRLRKRENAITLDNVREFKGLESKVLILCDPPHKNNTQDGTRKFLYTAVSRCICYLIILSTREGCERIKSGIIHVESVLDSSDDFASSEEA